MKDTLEGKLGAIERDSGNVEVQWNNIKGCVLDTLSELSGTKCLLHRLAEGVWPSQLDQINADSKENWY